MHPFNGWEDNDYDPAIHGNPVSITTAPNTSSEPPYNPIAIELVDKSNCQTAGDLICDTPASYNFANLYWAGKGCLPMDESVKDKNNQIVNPDEENIMDYFQGCTNYNFSPTQQNLINADLTNRINTFGNQKITATYVPNQDVVSGQINFPYPFDKSAISNFGDINLYWEDVPGATHYFVMIDVTSSFSFQPKSAIVTSSNWTATGLVKNKKYNWLVYPYNERSTCAGSNVFEFTTGSWAVSTSEIKELDNWKIQPNPATGGNEVILQAQSIDAFNAEIQILDITGRVMNTQHNVKFFSGDNQIRLSTENLNAGLYFVQIQSESGKTTQKMIIE